MNPIRPAAEALAARVGGTGVPPTEPQTDYIAALVKGLHIPKRMLDDHCVREFGRPFAEIDRRQASWLIDQLLAWQENDAELRRAMGQLDLF